MQLEHSFIVPADVDSAWVVLTDIERVAPCMPGAALESVDGDDFTGIVKVKLGPIGLTYRGSARWVERDDVGHRAIIEAQGRDARGNGTASAIIKASLSADTAGPGSRVDVLTDLNITGKPAQFGRGVMVDVGNKLIGQFADCLANKLASGSTDSATAPETGAAVAPEDENPELASVTAVGGLAGGEPVTRSVSSLSSGRAEPEPIDLLGSAGPAVLKRLVPVLAVAGAVSVGILLLRLRARRS